MLWSRKETIINLKYNQKVCLMNCLTKSLCLSYKRMMCVHCVQRGNVISNSDEKMMKSVSKLIKRREKTSHDRANRGTISNA